MMEKSGARYNFRRYTIPRTSKNAGTKELVKSVKKYEHLLDKCLNI